MDARGANEACSSSSVELHTYRQAWAQQTSGRDRGRGHGRLGPFDPWRRKFASLVLLAISGSDKQ